jgi:RNA 3'-phosphate cyclase
MIEIDGSYGSGGGQILRTAIGLSTLTGKPCRIDNIRARRGNPGLREQHLQAILAVNDLAKGKLENAKLGSQEITFYPGETLLDTLKAIRLKINISTAGSIGLVLQALLIPATQLLSLEIEIIGGATWGKWAPPLSHLENIFFPLLARFGYPVRLVSLKEGFYPKGGAEAKIITSKARFVPLRLTELGEIRSIRGVSLASLSLREQKVAERQRDVAEQGLAKYFKIQPYIDAKYVPANCPGSGIQLWINTTKSILGANALGERGKKAETVGEEAVNNLIREYESGGALDSHTADQVLPYLAMAGGEIKVSKITDHCKTNIWVIEKFLPAKFAIEDKTISCVKG